MFSPEQINHQYTPFWWDLRSARQTILFACLMSAYQSNCTMVNSVGGQRKRFKDTLKTSLQHWYLNMGTTCSKPHTLAWTHQQGLSSSRREADSGAQQKRELRKARAASTSSTPDSSLVCPSCARSFRAKIGLISHLWTHQNQSSSTSMFLSRSSSLAKDEPTLLTHFKKLDTRACLTWFVFGDIGKHTQKKTKQTNKQTPQQQQTKNWCVYLKYRTHFWLCWVLSLSHRQNVRIRCGQEACSYHIMSV